MRRIRALHIITRLIVGGAQEMLLLAARGLAEHGIDVQVLAGPQTGPEGSLLPEFEEAGIPTTVLPDLLRDPAPLADLRALKAMGRIMRDGEYDIIHTHTAKAGILGRQAAARARIRPVVHHIHGWSFSGYTGVKRRLFARLERRAARQTDALIAVTHRDIDKGLSAGIARREQYHLVRAAIDLSRFPRASAEQRAEARSRLGIAPDEFCVGSTGRLSRQKAPVELVRAVALASRDAPLRVVLVGDGPLRADVEDEIARSGLGDRALLLGLRRDVEEVLPTFDVYASAAHWEGLPRALVEALSVGVPVAATAVDGVPELIADGHTGLLVERGDVEALAAAITRLRDDAELRHTLIEAGREAVAEYSADEMCQRLAALYRDLLAGPPA